MSVVTIIPAKLDDYQSVAEIYNEHIALHKSTMDEKLFTAEDINTWVEKFHDRERLFVLKRQDVVLGWGIIKRYSDRLGYAKACETAIYLRQEETGKGLGSKMKRFLLDTCKQLGYHHLVAKIFAENRASIIYNQKLGYEVVGTQKEIGFKNGKWVDIVIMQYVFDE